VPLDEGCAEGGGDLVGEDGLAGAGFPFNEERALEGDGGVDGDFEVAGGDVAGGGLEGGTGEYSEWRYWEFEGCGVKGRIRSVAKDA